MEYEQQVAIYAQYVADYALFVTQNHLVNSLRKFMKTAVYTKINMDVFVIALYLSTECLYDIYGGPRIMHANKDVSGEFDLDRPGVYVFQVDNLPHTVDTTKYHPEDLRSYVSKAMVYYCTHKDHI